LFEKNLRQLEPFLLKDLWLLRKKKKKKKKEKNFCFYTPIFCTPRVKINILEKGTSKFIVF